MKHPHNRSERRHNGIVWRNRQRFIMLNCWFYRGDAPEWFTNNTMWWARKQMQCHSDCCNAHKKSSKEIRKRRRTLDDLLLQALQEENEERFEQGLGEIVLF